MAYEGPRRMRNGDRKAEWGGRRQGAGRRGGLRLTGGSEWKNADLKVQTGVLEKN